MENQSNNNFPNSTDTHPPLTPRTLARSLYSSEKDLFKLKKVFSAFDLNGDGCITKQELKTVLKNIGKPLIESQTSRIMESLDLDKNGSISFVEFLRGYSQLEELTGSLSVDAENQPAVNKETMIPSVIPHRPKEVRKYTPAELETIKEIFTNYDKDGDGSVSLQDLKTAFLKDFNKSVSNTEIEHMFIEIDTDGDGKISFVEFLRGYAQIEQLSGVFPAEKLRKPQRTRRGSVGSWSMPRRFTPEELSQFHDVFDSNCRIKGQLVVPEEFKSAIDKLGRSMTGTQLGTVMKELNLKDGDTLNFVDFVKSIDRLDTTTYTSEEKELIKHIFKHIGRPRVQVSPKCVDSKGLGRINKKQIIQFLEQLKSHIPSDIDYEILPLLNQLSPEALLSTFEGFDSDAELTSTEFSSAFLTLDKSLTSVILKKFASMMADLDPNAARMTKIASMPVMPVSRRGSLISSTISPIARAAMVSSGTPPLSPKSQTPRSPLSARSSLIEEEEEANILLFEKYDKGDGLLSVPQLKQLVQTELLQDAFIPDSEVDLLLEICFNMDLEKNPMVRKKAFLEGFPKMTKSIQKKKKLMLQNSAGSSGILPVLPSPENSKPTGPSLSLSQRFQWPEKQKEASSYSEWKQQHPHPPHRMSAEFLKKFLPEGSTEPPSVKKKGSSNTSPNSNPPKTIVTLAILKGSSPSASKKLTTQEKIQKLKSEWEKDRVKRQAEGLTESPSDEDLIPTEAMSRSRGSPARSRKNSGLRRIQVITVPQETLLAKEARSSKESSPRVNNSPPKLFDLPKSPTPPASPVPPSVPSPPHSQYDSDRDAVVATRPRSNSSGSVVLTRSRGNSITSEIQIPKLNLEVLTSDSDSAKPTPAPAMGSSSDSDSDESDRDEKFAELRKQLQALDSQLSLQQQQVEEKQKQQEELLAHFMPIHDIQRKIEAIMAKLNSQDNDSETTRRLEDKLRDLQQQASKQEVKQPPPVFSEPKLIEEQIYEKKMQQYHPNRQDSTNRLVPPKQSRPILSPKRSLAQLPVPAKPQQLSPKETQHIQQQMILQRQKRLLEEKKLQEQPPPEKKEHIHIPPQHFIAVRSEQAKADMEKYNQPSPKRNFLSVEEVERRHKLREQENVQRARERDRLRMQQRQLVQKKLEMEMKRQFEENMQKQEMERKKKEIALRKLIKAEQDEIQRHKEDERMERIRRKQMEQEEDEKAKKFREKSRAKLKEIEQQLKENMGNKEIYKGFIKDVNNQLAQLKLKHDKFVEHNLTKQEKRERAIATVERLYSLAKMPESKEEEKKPKKNKKKMISLKEQKRVWQHNEIKRKQMKEMSEQTKEQKKAAAAMKKEEKKRKKLHSEFHIPEDNKTAALHEENKKRITKRLVRVHEFELSLRELQRLLEAASEGDADPYAKLEELGVFEESLLRLAVQDLGRESSSFIREYIKSEWDGSTHTTHYLDEMEIQPEELFDNQSNEQKLNESMEDVDHISSTFAYHFNNNANDGLLDHEENVLTQLNDNGEEFQDDEEHTCDTDEYDGELNEDENGQQQGEEYQYDEEQYPHSMVEEPTEGELEDNTSEDECEEGNTSSDQ